MIEWGWAMAIAVFALSLYFSCKPSQYQPDEVFRVQGDSILVGHTPLARWVYGFRKQVKQQSITKIQCAGKMVTLFNASGNAIDIAVPRSMWVAPIVTGAQDLFTNAELIEIKI